MRRTSAETECALLVGFAGLETAYVEEGAQGNDEDAENRSKDAGRYEGGFGCRVRGPVKNIWFLRCE